MKSSVESKTQIFIGRDGAGRVDRGEAGNASRAGSGGAGRRSVFPVQK